MAQHRTRKWAALFLSAALTFSQISTAVYAQAPETGLCEHHPQHTAECGYTEGSEGTPCTHEHTGDCYTLVTECVHEHGPECYPEESAETAEDESVSGNTATPSDAEEQEPTACTHECSEESGCITKELDCQHEHDETCGYAPATGGTPCTYVCEVCNPQDSGETEETEPEAECICTEHCTEETTNAECPVCGAEGTDLTACEGMEAEIATLSNALAAEPKADTGVFTVIGGTLGEDYTYSDPPAYESDGAGVLTVKTSTELTISTSNATESPANGRIVIEDNVTANITLNGLSIKPAEKSSNDGYSGIDLGSGATLNLTLQNNTTNEIHGGTSGSGTPAPGIRVPGGSTLTIDGDGSLEVKGAPAVDRAAVGIGGMGSVSEDGEACGNVILLGGTITVHGGTASTSSSPVDIGGGASDTQKGGDCNTVIILTSVNSGEGLEIGGGAGASIGGGNGSDGTGIKPTGDGTYTVYGDLELPCDITIPEGATVVIPEGASLTVPEGKTLTNNGTILVQGGTFTGDVTGNPPTYPSTVTVSFSQNGQPVTSVPYGSTVTITATMEKENSAANALSADTGEVNFYLSDANDDTGIMMGIGTVKFEGGAYTASVDVTIDQGNGFNNAGTFKFTADFGGYVPSEGASGDSLAPAIGSAQLTVTKDDSALDLTAKKGGVETTAFTYGDTITIEGSVKGAEDSANTLNLDQNTAQLYCGETPLGQAVNVVDGSFTLSYDTSEKGIPIGNQTLTVKYGGSGIFNESSGTVEITLSKKPVTAQVASERITKQYNGEPDVEVDLNFAEGELVGEDEVTVSAPDAKFSDPNVGNDKEINLGDLVVGGNDAGWYEVSAPENVTGTIVMASTRLNVSVNQDGKFVYGDKIIVTFTPEAEYVPMPGNRSLSVDADNAVLYFEDEDDNEVVLARTTGGEDDVFTLTYDTGEKKLPCDDEPFMLYIKYGGSSNLQGVEGYAQITLERAPLRNTPTVTGDFVFGKTLTANYTKQDDETVTYQWYRGDQPIDGATDVTYTLTAEDVGQPIAVTVTATDDYHTGSVTSTPVTVGKAGLAAPQNLTLASAAPGKATAAWEKVQNASGYTVQLYKDGEADGDPIITTGTSCEFSIAEAGSYTVKVKANDSDNYADSTEVESNGLTFYNVTVNGSYAQTSGTDVYTEGATVSIDAGTRDGYTFDGWTGSDGVTFANAGSAQTSFTMPGKSVTVTASWVPNSSEVGDQEFVRYIVQHYKQNTDGSYRLEDAEYPIGKVGETVTATARNYEGHTYNAEKSNASGTLTEIKSDADIVTLKLYYDLTVFTVTVETSGNGTASASPASATMGQTVTLTANAAGGYHFVKWEVVSGGIVLNGNTFTMPAGNVTVRAVFERTSTGGGGGSHSGGGGGTGYSGYTISASAGAGGSISPSGSVSVRCGDDKTFTITPADGYRISDVLVDGKSVGAAGSYTFEDVRGAHTIEAVFAKENPDTGVDSPFTDVKPGDWFYDHVMFVYGNGLMNGTSATTFSPNEAAVRAQIAVIFYRMAGSPEVTGDSLFTDVENGPGTAWYYNAVLWAHQNGIVAGYGDGTYHPGDPVTREQLAVMFYNYANYKGYDLSATSDLSGFTDVGKISDWALPAMRWAVGSGLMNGYGDGTLNPQGIATRAQLAAMLHSFIAHNKLVPPAVAPGGDSGTGGTGGIGGTGTGSGGGGWTQQKPVPLTGDNSNMGLWISFCVLSFAGLAGTTIMYVHTKRKRGEE